MEMTILQGIGSFALPLLSDSLAVSAADAFTLTVMMVCPTSTFAAVPMAVPKERLIPLLESVSVSAEDHFVFSEDNVRVWMNNHKIIIYEFIN